MRTANTTDTGIGDGDWADRATLRHGPALLRQLGSGGLIAMVHRSNDGGAQTRSAESRFLDLVHPIHVNLVQMNQQEIRMLAHTGLFPISTAAKVSGAPVNTIRTWFKRNQIWFDDSEMQLADRKGLPHLLSFASVMRIAIMTRLNMMGFAPEQAWKYTAVFTEAGDFGSAGDQYRQPGELYSEGETILIADPQEEFGRVINILDTTPALAVLNLKTAVAFMNVSALWREVSENLTTEID